LLVSAATAEIEIELEDPPFDPSRKRGGKTPRYLGLLLAIRDQSPGEWAVVERCEDRRRAYNLASNLRRGGIKVPEGHFEFASQKTGDNWTVYARAWPR
jgi:hypothetical protein